MATFCSYFFPDLTSAYSTNPQTDSLDEPSGWHSLVSMLTLLNMIPSAIFFYIIGAETDDLCDKKRPQILYQSV